MDSDSILDALEVLIDGHPNPLTREHCQYCSAWLVIIEDIIDKED